MDMEGIIGEADACRVWQEDPIVRGLVSGISGKRKRRR